MKRKQNHTIPEAAKLLAISVQQLESLIDRRRISASPWGTIADCELTMIGPVYGVYAPGMPA